jgi:nucleolar protein 56
MTSGSVILFELGICVLDHEGNVVLSRKFGDPVGAYDLLQKRQMPQEIKNILNELNHFDTVVVNEDNLYSILKNGGQNVEMMSTDQQQEYRKNAASFAVRCGVSSDEATAVQQLRDFAISLSSSRVREASGRLDLHVIQAINALDELDKIINILAARMREWYGLHFPELDHLVQSLTAFAKIVSSAGTRDKITDKVLQYAGIQEKKGEIILSAASRSKGGDITDENLKLVRRLADQVTEQSQLRDDLANIVETSMEIVAPNVKELLTASVSARMIAMAGGLQKLAMLPASTIQILGAEKALFRSLKTGANPPKHGMLFQHPTIHAAPKWQRGKIARAIAAKVAIAARIDAYRHDGKDPLIAEKLRKRITEIQEKNKLPPSEDERARKYQEHKRRQTEYFGSRGDRRRERRWPRGRMNHQPYQERFKQVRGEGRELAGGLDQSQLPREGRYPRRFGDWKRERPSKMNKGKKKKFKKSKAQLNRTR